MSVPFTTPTKYNFLSTDILNELIVAYNEYDNACFYGSAQMEPLAKGQNLQDYHNDDLDPMLGGFWSRLQHQILGNYQPPLNHVLGPLTADKLNFRYFTWPQFFAAAGLPAYGPRHVRTGSIHDPIWLTNPRYALPGDMIGPWLVEDLQKIYSAARWTVRIADGTDIESIMQIPFRENPVFPAWDWYNQSIGDYAGFAASRLAGFNASMASWGGHPWGTNNEHTLNGFNVFPPLLYLRTAGYAYGWKGAGVGDWASYGKIDRARRKGKARITGLPSIPHIAEIYLKLVAEGDSFNDLDGLGWNEDELTLVETFGESASTEHEQTNYVGEYTDDPALLAGLTAGMNEQFDDPGYSGGAPASGCKIDWLSNWLIKWNFTYQNT